MSKKAKIAILCVNITLIIVLVIILILRNTGKKLPGTQNSTTKLTELPTVATEIKSEHQTEAKTEPKTEVSTEKKDRLQSFDDSAYMGAPEVETKEYQPGEIKVGEEYPTKEFDKTIFYDKTGFFPSEKMKSLWDEVIPLSKKFLNEVFTFSGDKKEYTKRLKAYWYGGDKYGITKSQLKQVANMMSYNHANATPKDVKVIACIISDTDDTNTDFTIHVICDVTADFTFDGNTETPNVTVADIYILKEPDQEAKISGLIFENTVKAVTNNRVSTDGSVQIKSDVDTILQAWDQKSYTDEALQAIKESTTADTEKSTEEPLDLRTH